MQNTEHMSDRLRRSRVTAGFRTASDAVLKFGWKKSTYIAHEIGQNDFDPEQAGIYARAFKVSPEMLLFGERPPQTDTPGIDRQLKDMPPEVSRELIARFNAMIEGVKLGRKL